MNFRACRSNKYFLKLKSSAFYNFCSLCIQKIFYPIYLFEVYVQKKKQSGPEVIKLFMLNSVENEIYHANNCYNANNCWNLKFINMINTSFERSKARTIFFLHFCL